MTDPTSPLDPFAPPTQYAIGPAQPVGPVAPAPPAGVWVPYGLKSPDERHWWDGATWMDAERHPQPPTRRAPGPSAVRLWLAALAPLALLAVVVPYCLMLKMAPDESLMGSNRSWFLLLTLAYGVGALMATAGAALDRVALARHGRDSSGLWLVACLLAWPIAAPALMLTRVARTKAGIAAFFGTWMSWLSVTMAGLCALGVGWMLASGWSSDDLTDDLTVRLTDESTLPGDDWETLDATCPEDAWLLVNQTITCTVTVGDDPQVHRVDVHLDEYYDYTWSSPTAERY